MPTSKAFPGVDPAVARSFEEAAIDRLKQRGLRITMPRVQVIRALAQSSEALSAYAIHQRIMAMGGRIDVVSVYRILAALGDAGLVHHVGVADGYIANRIERPDPKHSLHVVCKESGQVRELTVPQEAIEAIQGVLDREGFQADSARIEVVGKPV